MFTRSGQTDPFCPPCNPGSAIRWLRELGPGTYNKSGTPSICTATAPPLRSRAIGRSTSKTLFTKQDRVGLGIPGSPIMMRIWPSVADLPHLPRPYEWRDDILGSTGARGRLGPRKPPPTIGNTPVSGPAQHPVYIRLFYLEADCCLRTVIRWSGSLIRVRRVTSSERIRWRSGTGPYQYYIQVSPFELQTGPRAPRMLFRSLLRD